jgi:catechol 2,3-dioxygenase-like lactoylglutathione lyase family enzyme
MLHAGNLFIELFEFHSPAPRDIDRGMNDFGVTHFSFEVENVHEAFATLKAHGIQWHSDPIDAGDGYLMTYGRDPFGNVIEIQQVPEERPYSFAQLRAR